MWPLSGQGEAQGSLWLCRQAPTLRCLRGDIKSVRFSVSGKWTPSGLPTLSSLRTVCPPLLSRPSSPSPCRLLPVMKGEWHTSDTLLLPMGQAARAQGLCLASLLRFEHGARERAVWPLTAGPAASAFPQHVACCCRLQSSPAPSCPQARLPRVSSKLVKVSSSWTDPCLSACGATPGDPRSPRLEPARAF